VREARERPQPLRHRTRLVGRQGAKFGADARPSKDLEAFVGVRHGSVPAEQRRHVDREPGVAHPAGKARDVRADAGHFAHDDDRRSRAGDVHPSGHALERDLATGEIVQRIVFLDAARRTVHRI
jgi:hypothetical protein